MQRFLSFRVLASIGVVMLALAVTAPRTQSQTGVTEAATGLAATSNGFAEEFCGTGQFRQANVASSPNSPRIPDDECSFEAAATEFGAEEAEEDGVGPVFNNNGCGTCHFTPAMGGSSQITEASASSTARCSPITGGSLIQDQRMI